MSPRRVAPRRRLVAAGIAAAVGAASLIIPSSAAHASISVGALTGRSAHGVSAGVTLTEGTVRISGWSQSVYLLNVDLRYAGLNTVLANDKLNSPGESVLHMAQRTGAVAGVNGDLFDLISNRSPYGGVVSNGGVIKTPNVGTPEQFYVQANGVAGIGPVTFTGTLVFKKVVRTSTGRRAVTVKKTFPSINNLRMAASGRLTLLTSALGSSSIPRGCVLASLASVRGGWKLTGISTSGSSLAGLATRRRALIGCHSAGSWLRTAIPRGTVVQIHGLMTATGAPASLPIRTLIGGPRILVSGARAYGDRHSAFVTFGRNPETWVCVDKTGRNVQIGVLDGRDWLSRGVTLAELQAYLVSEHCWRGIVLDGGGSSAVAADLGGGLQIQDNPATGTWNLRPLADSLMIYDRS